MTIQLDWGIPFGILDCQANASVSAETFNASTAYLAFSFVAQAATSLSAIRFYCMTLVGSPTANCQLFGDAGYKPDISGGALDTLTVGTLSNSAWIAATGGTYSLTRGTRYWVVFYNTAATPSTNYWVQYSFNAGYSSYNLNSEAAATSTNTGTSWTILQQGGGIRFDFADGTYLGIPIKGNVGLTSYSLSSQTIYSTREAGVQFTTPPNAKMNVAGIKMLMSKSGTPTGDLYFKLYDSTHTKLAETDHIPNAEAMGATAWHGRLFTSGAGIQTLSAATTYTITAVETTQSDTSSNVFRCNGYVLDTDTNSIPLVPYSAQLDCYDGTSWSQTQGSVPLFALVLASGDEFTSTGGGGGTTGYAFCA